MLQYINFKFNLSRMPIDINQFAQLNQDRLCMFLRWFWFCCMRWWLKQHIWSDVGWWNLPENTPPDWVEAVQPWSRIRTHGICQTIRRLDICDKEWIWCEWPWKYHITQSLSRENGEIGCFKKSLSVLLFVCGVIRMFSKQWVLIWSLWF